MNTIELKQTKSDEKTPLQIFKEAAVGQAFRIRGLAIETIGVKCFVNNKYFFYGFKRRI